MQGSRSINRMAKSPDNTALAPYYYRDNFLRLCETVEARYGDILSTAEQSLLQRFRQLSLQAQCLYVRLVSRVGPWFRECKLSYDELGPLAPAVDELLQQALAIEAQDISPEALGKLYTQSELLHIFAGHLRAGKFPGKAALVLAIEQLQLEGQETMAALCAFEHTRLIAPLDGELVTRLQILFFGNRHQSLTDFVLQDLGVTRYYPYALDQSERLFPCREALEEYLACAELSDRYREQQEQGDPQQLLVLAEAVLTMTIRFPSSENRWQRLCNTLGRDLERQQQWQMAEQLYCRGTRHPARERRARVMEARSNWAAATALCQEIVQDPWCEEEYEAARRILPRVQRKLDGTRRPRQRDNFKQTKLRLPPTTGTVEQRTAAHLAKDWQSVHYVENSLMNTLFGLAFWEQIFAAVPGVFHHAYQSVPADMYEPVFRQKRAASLAARMAQLRDADLSVILVEAYHRYKAYQCRWVDWLHIDADLLHDVTRVIPNSHLLAIWQRMLFDPRENRRGFPDLIALGSARGDYCLIEVKGPGDALQDNQKRWLRFFQREHIPAQVAWVQWRDD